jgi:5-methylcytosine-specific restriction endonuclease McrA
VRDFRQFEMGTPPSTQVLDELRRRFSQGERHLQCDHQLTIEDRPDLRLTLSNLRTRCSSCHSAKTMVESVKPIR